MSERGVRMQEIKGVKIKVTLLLSFLAFYFILSQIMYLK